MRLSVTTLDVHAVVACHLPAAAILHRVGSMPSLSESLCMLFETVHAWLWPAGQFSYRIYAFSKEHSSCWCRRIFQSGMANFLNCCLPYIVWCVHLITLCQLNADLRTSKASFSTCSFQHMPITRDVCAWLKVFMQVVLFKLFLVRCSLVCCACLSQVLCYAILACFSILHEVPRFWYCAADIDTV